jgi:signal transduction histidine kinase
VSLDLDEIRERAVPVSQGAYRCVREEDFDALVGVIGEESRRLDRIVSNLLTLGRPLAPEVRVTDAFELVRIALDVHRQRDPSLALSIELAEARPPSAIVADPDLVQLALLNVLRNAAEAIEPGGRVLVGFEPRGEDALAIVVDDSGPGFSSDVSARLFEPFFTTKAAQSGTGLGLAVVFGVVTEFGGAVDVQSRPGQGAHFTLYLPESTDDAEASAPDTPAAGRGAGGHESDPAWWPGSPGQ